jgi:HAD superfamily hydrolase (TIGR01509 family)
MSSNIKLVIFDLDGVLVDTDEWHYTSLIDAILANTDLDLNAVQRIVRRDGTSTIQKLKTLGDVYHLSSERLEAIDALKQKMVKIKLEGIDPDQKVERILSHLKSMGMLIALGSNSREENVRFILQRLGVSHYFNAVVTPNWHLLPKPKPDMFLAIMATLGVVPENTLIVEDSPTGQQAAKAAGARLLAVDHAGDLTLESVLLAMQ